jgi:hypothetical protein
MRDADAHRLTAAINSQFQHRLAAEAPRTIVPLASTNGPETPIDITATIFSLHGPNLPGVDLPNWRTNIRHKENNVRIELILTICLALPLAASAKDQPTFQIEVVGTDAWQRDLEIHHAGTAGTANTNCNTDGNVNETTYGNMTNGSVNATTNCTATSTPGTPAYTTHHAIQQESVHAILNGQRVTLWCQVGFRKCANLTPGTYTAEADGDKAVKIYVYSLISHKLMGKMKYRLVGGW